MPDFSARFTDGTTVIAWSDPASATKPSRLNPHPGIAHSYHRAVIATPVTAKCTPDGGSEGALDSTLGGRLFTWWWAEHVGSAPMIFSAPGNSSIATFELAAVGSYLLVVQRDGGGRIGLHLRRE